MSGVEKLIMKIFLSFLEAKLSHHFTSNKRNVLLYISDSKSVVFPKTKCLIFSELKMSLMSFKTKPSQEVISESSSTLLKNQLILAWSKLYVSCELFVKSSSSK